MSSNLSESINELSALNHELLTITKLELISDLNNKEKFWRCIGYCPTLSDLYEIRSIYEKEQLYEYCALVQKVINDREHLIQTELIPSLIQHFKNNKLNL